MPPTYSDYLMEGARKLSTVKFGFSVRRDMWDRRYWEETGTRQKGAKILRLKLGKSATVAVQSIFDNPRIWSFDCSQFCQVINFYAQMKTINASDGGDFDRQIRVNGNRLEIKPFHGAYFTVREHYYRRERQTDWLKYRASSNMPYEETRITAWDLVRAAPVGTRVNFNVGAGGAWNYENTIKVKVDPLKFSAQGLGTNKIFKHGDLLIELAKKRDSSVRTVEDAAKIIWIKEVSIFRDLPVPPHRER